MTKKNHVPKFLSLMVAAALVVPAILAAGACSSGNNTTPGTTSSSGVSFARDIQPIFNANCVVCHAGAGQAGLTLEASVSYSKLVGVASTESPGEMRVKAGSPDQSYLIAKLKGTQVSAGGSGAQMPLNASPLSQSQISLIEQWIQAGAPNN